MLTAREEAFLRAVAMNDGQKEKKPFLFVGTRSGIKNLSLRWPDGVFRYQFSDTFYRGQKDLVRRKLREFAEEISSTFPGVQS